MKYELVFEVAANGIAIENEQIEKIFLAYKRIPIQNYKRKRIGLGLLIVKQTVKALQGEVWIESVFGKGTLYLCPCPSISAMRMKFSFSLRE